jgi:hypothetical protein
MIFVSVLLYIFQAYNFGFLLQLRVFCVYVFVYICLDCELLDNDDYDHRDVVKQ